MFNDASIDICDSDYSDSIEFNIYTKKILNEYISTFDNLELHFCGYYNKFREHRMNYINLDNKDDEVEFIDFILHESFNPPSYRPSYAKVYINKIGIFIFFVSLKDTESNY